VRQDAARGDIRRLMLFFAIVYAVEGIGQARVGIILQPLTNYLKSDGWTPLQVTAYFGALNFPWVIKPVFGLVSDLVPLFGYRRISYLILASACAAAGYAGIAVLDQPSEFALFLLLTSYAMATASTLCGALLAENGRTFERSSLFVGQQWLWFYVAIMLSAFLGGELVEHLSASMALKAAAGAGKTRGRPYLPFIPLRLSFQGQDGTSTSRTTAAGASTCSATRPESTRFSGPFPMQTRVGESAACAQTA